MTFVGKNYYFVGPLIAERIQKRRQLIDWVDDLYF